MYIHQSGVSQLVHGRTRDARGVRNRRHRYEQQRRSNLFFFSCLRMRNLYIHIPLHLVHMPIANGAGAAGKENPHLYSMPMNRETLTLCGADRYEGKVGGQAGVASSIQPPGTCCPKSSVIGSTCTPYQEKT